MSIAFIIWALIVVLWIILVIIVIVNGVRGNIEAMMVANIAQLICMILINIFSFLIRCGW